MQQAEQDAKSGGSHVPVSALQQVDDLIGKDMKAEQTAAGLHLPDTSAVQASSFEPIKASSGTLSMGGPDHVQQQRRRSVVERELLQPAVVPRR